MLPRKLHIEEINRFHDKIQSLSEEIEKTKDFDLILQYLDLTKFWGEIDDFFEFKIKMKLDALDNLKK